LPASDHLPCPSAGANKTCCVTCFTQVRPRLLQIEGTGDQTMDLRVRIIIGLLSIACYAFTVLAAVTLFSKVVGS